MECGIVDLNHGSNRKHALLKTIPDLLSRAPGSIDKLAKDRIDAVFHGPLYRASLTFGRGFVGFHNLDQGIEEVDFRSVPYTFKRARRLSPCAEISAPRWRCRRKVPLRKAA